MAVKTWLALAALAMAGAGCASSDPGRAPSVRQFLDMSPTAREATWEGLPQAERRVLNCRLEAWVSFTRSRSGLREGMSGPLEWQGSSGEWVEYATGNVPGVKECDRLRSTTS